MQMAQNLQITIIVILLIYNLKQEADNFWFSFIKTEYLILSIGIIPENLFLTNIKIQHSVSYTHNNIRVLEEIYIQRNGNVVTLSGYAENVTAAGGTKIAIIPEGYRPIYELKTFTVRGATGYYGVGSIGTNGEI